MQILNIENGGSPTLDIVRRIAAALPSLCVITLGATVVSLQGSPRVVVDTTLAEASLDSGATCQRDFVVTGRGGDGAGRPRLRPLVWRRRWRSESRASRYRGATRRARVVSAGVWLMNLMLLQIGQDVFVH